MTVGIINVLKPPGMTSHDVVSFVRKVYGQKRVGHAGTLDPAAAGVLPVFLGSATRLIEYTTDADKAYRVELTFGYSTDTGDDTGQVIEEAPAGLFPDHQELAAVLQTFTGEIQQVPPMHSAIKVGGKRLYEMAREGITIVREPRLITIKDITLLNILPPTIVFDVTCSKGTYIRSLCIDIGSKIGCPAVMSFLVRTRVGDFDLPNAKTLEEIAATPTEVLLPPDYAVHHLPQAVLSDPAVQALKFGQSVFYETKISNSFFRVYNEQGCFIGIGQKNTEANRLLPLKILSTAGD
ncbi:MAG: tRNA pseudouridine(55) synthase TruB [Negativicutes bacterium]|nr:tRNA pseudouridine(55) synthase TruB [Negativicutes bacterium]